MSEACEAASPVPESFQVAWVSRLATRVGAGSALEVVRVADLRKLVESNGRDATSLLQSLGAVGKKAHGDWKVTVFDVRREWLCRPVEGEPGTDIAGVPVCEHAWQKPGRGIRERSWSGCGYQLDSVTGERTIDTFRIDWRTASTWGFCVLPLERFLGGA